MTSMSGTISKAVSYPVRQVSVPHDLIDCDQSRPPAGILHTTEGGWDGAMSVFRQHFAPNFMVGRNPEGKVEIVQFIPIGKMAAAVQNLAGGVETNRWARVQIEIVGFSSLKPWLPGEDVCHALASLFDAIHDNPLGGIPLKRPFPDTLEAGITWASASNPRRRSGKWGTVSGWFGHVEVPENDHWDCGSLQVQDIFAMAPSRKPRLIGYTATYTTRAGDRKTVNVEDPAAWMKSHPDAKKRGSVVFRRRFA